MSAAFTHLKQIGAGCGGTVKLARRKADNKLYALKELELPRDPQEAASVLQAEEVKVTGAAHLGVCLQGVLRTARNYADCWPL